MRLNRAVLAVFFAVSLCGWMFAQDKIESLDLSRNLPIDSNVTVGKLKNGLTYYIRRNQKPEKRAELRLAVNVGSVVEDDDQRGIAHFCEHMAFDGTKNFKKQELVNYMESVGMRFGADLNASTSFDETVYMLKIPTDSTSVVRKAFQILEDWAHNVTYDDKEIDRERGVVIEEWRLGRGAEARMFDKQLPVLFKNSQYAVRRTIGDKKTLETCPHDVLRRFYKDWYRPDLMAVVVVGDFDRNEIEQLIKDHFAGIPAAVKGRERTMFPVPDHDESLFAVATDSEATNSRVGVYCKHDVHPWSTVGDYRRTVVEQLYMSMQNNRLAELARQADAPFLYGFVTPGRFVRTKDVYSMNAGVKDNGLERGLEALLTESERVKKFGFTQTELDREKKEVLRGMENTFNERDKTESVNYVEELVRHYLTDEPVPGIAYEFMLYRALLPGISLDEVNKVASSWITVRNRVTMVNLPQKKDIVIPSEDRLRSVFANASNKSIEAYVDKIGGKALVPNPPKPGTVVRESLQKDIGVTEWTLSNGARVVLKPTDFKNDEVLFAAISPGGTSLVADKDFIAASTCSQVIQQGGVGEFDLTELDKLLSDKIVRCAPYVGELDEGFSGSAAPQDLETLFQLTYLYFTGPRRDSTAFLSFLSRVKGSLENRSAQPEVAFSDTAQVTLAQHHFRRRPMTTALLDEMNLQTSYNVYRDRFADASDFIFFFVGNFQPATIKPLVETYLGGLPALHRTETWKDVGVNPPSGVIEKTVKKGIEPKSAVRIVFTGSFEWTREHRHQIQSMASVLTIKLREVLREEKGGVYGVGVGASPSHYPKERYTLGIGFGCAPERVDELVKAVFEQIDSLQKYGPGESYIQKIKEIQRREREVSLKENNFWISSLQSAYVNNEDPSVILNYPALIDKLSAKDVQTAAQRYFDMKNYVKVVLYPKEQ
ncbi:MAG: insulinase family protein [Bacteroidota bacterium]|jgi:zinc protease